MSVTGHKSIQSLSLYQRVKSDEKMMMGMSLAYSLFNAKEVSNALNELQDFENPNEIENKQELPAIEYGAQQVQAQNLLPMQSALQPLNVQQNEDIEPAMDFDLLDIINDINENQMVLAASQMEEKLATTTTLKTTKETTMFRSGVNHENALPFMNCKICSIGTININIYKK